jgi:molybdate transport system substrate-binding protein
MTRRYRDLRWLPALLAWALFAVPSAGGELLVGAATSLREAVEASARAFEATHPDTKLRLSYGASDVLAVQMRAGAPFDVLLSADEAITAKLDLEGLCEKPQPLARNRLVVVARPEIGTLSSAADLAGPAIQKIAISEIGVPVGRYAREWLAARGLLGRVVERIVPTEHARATLVAVDNGSVDAAIVYTTDARLAQHAHVVWEIPDAEQPKILYTAAVLRGARARAARDYVAFLIDGPGRADLERAGFAPPP